MTGPLILASASPRRHDLLAALGLGFAVVPAAIDEVAIAGDRDPAAAAIAVAAAKAGAVSGEHPGALVLAADTIVVLDDAVLGKPTDAGDARRMLAALRGRSHRVITATCVRVRGLPWVPGSVLISTNPNVRPGTDHARHASSEVSMRWNGAVPSTPSTSGSHADARRRRSPRPRCT